MRGFGRGGREPTILYSWRLHFNVSLLICVIVPVEQVVMVSLLCARNAERLTQWLSALATESEVESF